MMIQAFNIPGHRHKFRINLSDKEHVLNEVPNRVRAGIKGVHGAHRWLLLLGATIDVCCQLQLQQPGLPQLNLSLTSARPFKKHALFSAQSSILSLRFLR